MSSLPRSRGVKSHNGRIVTHSSGSASEDDLEEAVQLSHNAGGSGSGFNSAATNNNPVLSSLASSRRNRSLLVLTAVAAGVIALCFLFSPFSSISPRFSPSSYTAKPTENWPFITVQGTNFMEGCHPFFVTGINVDNLVEAAIADVSAAAQIQGPERISGREMVRNLLHTASKKYGINVVRTWAHTTDPSHPLQVNPGGLYAPDVFEALDFVIAQAEREGLRVQLSFVDMWRYRGGISEFVDWSKTAPRRDSRYPPLIVQGDVTPEMMTEEREKYENTRRALFYTDPDARSMYKAHVGTILTRRNVFTGKIYREDPTLFGFGLLNEARCEISEIPDCADLLQKWIEEMAVHFRTYDSRHLLTVGEEGFYGLDDASEFTNPGAAAGSRWAAESGQNFINNHKVPGISYAAIHAWPDNWSSNDNGEFMTQWIEQHAKDAETRLSMPLLLEEVGKKVEPSHGTPSQLKLIRDPVFKTVFRTVEHSIAQFGALQGSMLWQMEFRLYNSSPSTPYGVQFNDATFVIVDKHVSRVKTHALTHPLVYRDTSASVGDREKVLNENKVGCSAAEKAPCWVGQTMVLGWNRRCKNLPAVCRQIHSAFEAAAAAAAAASATGSSPRFDNTSGTLLTAVPSSSSKPSSSDVKVFRSNEECCAAESGAFASGCSSFFNF
jgi:hypothetical protein